MKTFCCVCSISKSSYFLHLNTMCSVIIQLRENGGRGVSENLNSIREVI